MPAQRLNAANAAAIIPSQRNEPRIVSLTPENELSTCATPPWSIVFNPSALRPQRDVISNRMASMYSFSNLSQPHVPSMMPQRCHAGMSYRYKYTFHGTPCSYLSFFLYNVPTWLVLLSYFNCPFCYSQAALQCPSACSPLLSQPMSRVQISYLCPFCPQSGVPSVSRLPVSMCMS